MIHRAAWENVEAQLHVESDVLLWVCSYFATSSYQQSKNKYH